MLDAAEIDTGRAGRAAAGEGRSTGVWLATRPGLGARTIAVDLGPTMAALDRALDRAEQVARTLRLDPGDMAAKLTLLQCSKAFDQASRVLVGIARGQRIDQEEATMSDRAASPKPT